MLYLGSSSLTEEENAKGLINNTAKLPKLLTDGRLIPEGLRPRHQPHPTPTTNKIIYQSKQIPLCPAVMPASLT